MRRALVRVLRPILRALGDRLRRNARLDYFDVQAVRDVVQVGDVIVTYRRGMVARLIPGHWSHAAMYVGEDYIVHAVYPEVERVRLADLVMDNDEVAVLRPRFANGVRRGQAANIITGWVGKPYDLGFGTGRDAFYCSEAIAAAYLDAVPSWDFEWRERLGVPTVTPQDLHDATNHFAFVAEWPGKS